MTKKGLVKGIPFGVGVGVGAAVNYTLTRYVGKQAKRIFQAERGSPTDPEPTDPVTPSGGPVIGSLTAEMS